MKHIQKHSQSSLQAPSDRLPAVLVGAFMAAGMGARTGSVCNPGVFAGVFGIRAQYQTHLDTPT